ncbi:MULTISPECIES: gpW family head-tail joining protein [unclassified Vibrio]|uniref:gpW family head-tail joining protein n=1 Tax=unclassified Vibrio TaxID=2614977 RepID=UPI0013618A11|nr:MULTISPECIES: gpW family head-tail joining protein [unclassified Vibrio]NAW57003.1 phage tail protein [Vibrio sp. V36_P2S2PM302]NAX27627.1 phage tail protein [Vibrio sp. V38_P2S17PM301]NAX29403.1 phage tail protein [Vibrio sp. V37_P2S8PM304]
MTLQEMLQEAESAYHKLQTGTMAVSVQKGERRVEFNRANIHELRAYIEDLRQQLGMGSARRRRPAGVGL